MIFLLYLKKNKSYVKESTPSKHINRVF